MEERNFKQRLTLSVAIPKIEHFCLYQERCHKEVKAKLKEFGLDNEDVLIAMRQMVQKDFLNEERFAIAYAGSKFRQKSWGKLKIIRELKQREISEYCIKKAIAEIEKDDYHTSLFKLAEKYQKTVKTGKVYEKKIKITRYLMSKGYEYAQCQSVVNELNWE